MDENTIINYKRQMTGAGILTPYSVSSILEGGGIQHNLRDHLAIIFKHKYKVATVFVLFIMLAPLAYLAINYFLPSLFEAKSILMVKSGREYSDPELGTTKTPISIGREDIFTSEIILLKSRDLTQRIISTVGLERMYPDIVAHPPDNLPPMEAAIIAFGKKLAVNEVRSSNFIEVSFRHKEPEISARVVNLLVDYYMEKRNEVLRDPKAVFFLEQKLAEFRQKLRESEEKLETFRRNYGFYSFDKQMDFLLKKKSQIEESIATAQDDVQTLRATHAILSNQLKLVPQVIGSVSINENSSDSLGNLGNDELKLLKTKLIQLRENEVELLTKYTERNQFVINVRNEIKAMEELIKKEEAPPKNAKQNSSGRSNNIASQSLEDEKSGVEANISAAEAKITNLKEELANYQKQINDLGSQEKRLNELHREKEHNEQYYKVYANKVEELRISQDIGRQEMPSVTVIQAAVPPAKPVSKTFSIWLYFAVFGVLGIAAGIGLAYLLEFLSQGIRTPEGVEARLGLPVLATVPLGTS